MSNKESVFDSLIDIPKPKEDLHNLFTPDPIQVEIVKKKKPINSKAKGKGFEGEIAKQLSTTFKPYEFKRVLHSGAILGGKNVASLGKYSEAIANLFIGDVVCINDADQEKDFRFSIECKFYKTPETMDNFLGVVNSNLPKWYEEAVVDAAKVKKDPLLIVKWNRSSIYCIIGNDTGGTWGLPATVDKFVHLSFPRLKVFLFKDALTDQEWWFKNKDNK